MTKAPNRLLYFALLGVTACRGDADGTNEFVSDNPGGNGGRGDDYNNPPTGDDGGDGVGGDDGEDGDGGGGEQAIEEADLIRIVDDRLYALSELSGLTIIDVSQRDRLPVLGRYRAHARPFEMYVEGDQVFVMFSDFGEYSYAEDFGYNWHQNSRLLALDASDPGDITVRGEFELPGTIQDSRRVADILYLVTYENGYCWGCQDAPNTTITSLDVSDPADVSIADQLTFESDEDDYYYYYGGQRSVTSTTERMYVAGSDWSGQAAQSTISVVDISDDSGALVQGATLSIAGQIDSRWQMDEYDGVLRVISQPPGWDLSDPPVLETFQIASSDEFVPLASLPLVLPRPEQLRSARFDGDRAYAITFERTDPLFTFDLSDPAAPVQTGELEIPGWVHHMEPRGDRILGLGFDQSAPEGAINVSLFDVSDLTQPQMLDRVHFGGDWAQFSEDQNRLHKAFTILDEEGLLLVPFEGRSWGDYEYDYCSTYRSGIQLIDFTADDLVLRGFAESHGRARRSFLHDERMFAISDMSVQTFDITDRDAPVQKLGLAMAANVDRSVRAGDHVVRISTDWWNSEQRLEVVSADDAGDPMPLGVLPLNDVIADEGQGYYGDGGCYGLYDAKLVANGDYVYLVHRSWGRDKGTTNIVVVDISEPAAPTHVDTVVIDVVSESWWGSFGGFQLPSEQVVLRGTTMVLATNETDWSDESQPKSTAGFLLVDVSEPAAPEELITLDRPEAVQHGGLQVYGDTLVSWHAKQVGDSDSKVAFYLERLDLGGERPLQRKDVNVPGVPIAYDPDDERAITLDFRVEILEDLDSYEECYSDVKAYGLGDDGCMLVRHHLNTVQLHDSSAERLDQSELEPARRVLSVMGSTSRAFAVTADRGSNYWGYDTPGGYADDGGDGVVSDGDSDDGYQEPQYGVTVISGLDDGEIQASDVLDLGAGHWGWGWDSGVAGDKLLMPANGGAAIIDGEDAQSPSLRVEPLYGQSCRHIAISGDVAYCSMGASGLQVIPLD